MTLTVLLVGNSLLLWLFGAVDVFRTGASPDIGLVLAIQALLLPLVTATTFGFVRLIERQGLAALGVRWPGGTLAGGTRWVLIANVAVGVILGGWLLATWLGAQVRFAGWSAEFLDGPSWRPGVEGSVIQLLALAAGFYLASAFEELIFRGYFFTALRERLSWVHAGGFSSLLFALAHTTNPGFSATALVNTFLLAFILAQLRELTASLWAATIFHGSWNFAIACLLSLPVSGITAPRLLAVEVSGSPALTGGSYGPEGSWLLTAPLTAAVLILAALLGDRPAVVEPPAS